MRIEAAKAILRIGSDVGIGEQCHARFFGSTQEPRGRARPPQPPFAGTCGGPEPTALRNPLSGVDVIVCCAKQVPYFFQFLFQTGAAARQANDI